MLATWGCATFPKPTLDLQFAGATSLDSRITFTRATTATYFNSAGVLTTAASGEARFDYNPSTLAPLGLLIEEARTNSILQSEDFATTWTVTGATVSTNATTAPNGAATADKLIADSAITVSPSSVAAFVRQDFTKAASATTYTFSVFAKAGEFNAIRLFVRDNATSANNAAASALLTNGTVLTAAAAGGTFTNASVVITNVNNGWYRVALTFTSSTETTIRCIYAVNDSSTTTGDASKGIFVFGAQLEAGAFATSYIPTTTTALTRNADVASMTGTNFSSWYNAVEGTLFVDAITPPNLSGFPTVATISDGSIQNQISHYLFTNGYYANVRTLNVVQGDISRTVSPVVGSVYKYAVGLILDNAAAAANGSLGTPDTALSMPVGVNQLRIGAGATGSAVSNTTIRRIAYYPTRLPNSTLQALTA